MTCVRSAHGFSVACSRLLPGVQDRFSPFPGRLVHSLVLARQETRRRMR